MGRREKAVTTEPNTVSTLGANLRRARQAKGVSLSDLAQKLGYSKSHLSVVETGRVWPSRELIQAYEAALDIKGGSLTQLSESLAPLRRARSVPVVNSTGVEQLLQRANAGVGNSEQFELAEPGEIFAEGETTAGRSSRDVAVALRWALELLQRAAQYRDPLPDQPIVVVSPAANGLFPPHTDRSGAWPRALQTVLARGWNVVQVNWLEQSDDDRLKLVTDMLDYFGFAGTFVPFSLPLPRGAAAPYGLVAIPGIGALQLLPTRTDQYGQYAVYGALLTLDSGSVSVLHDYGLALRHRATPIITAWEWPSRLFQQDKPEQEWLDYITAVTKITMVPGDRYFVATGPSTLTDLASGTWENGLRESKVDYAVWEPFVRAIRDNRFLRQTAFRDQVKSFKFREACKRSAIDQLAQGIAPENDALSSQSVGTAERTVRLRSIIDVLRAYPNYELALLDDEQPDLLANDSWLVKGQPSDGAVFLQTWFTRNGERWKMFLEITDSSVITAFRDYFQFAWENLGDNARSKESVIAYIERAIDRIAKR